MIDLRHGNCAEILPTLETDSVDMCLTDPPYLFSDLKLDKEFDPSVFKTVVPELKRVLKQNAWLFVFGNVVLQQYFISEFRFKFDYVWIKKCSVPLTYNAVRPMLQHESIIAYVQKDLTKMNDLYYDKDALMTHGHKPYIENRKITKQSSFQKETRTVRIGTVNIDRSDGARMPISILEFDSKPTMKKIYRTEHPTQKPFDLCAHLVKGYCPKDGIVLDPFCGSGSTLIGARDAGRKSIGIELNAEYFKMAKECCSEPLF